jgi:general secretion pathway protein G
VVIIIGVLAAAVVPNLVGRSQEARIAAVKQDIFGTLATSLDLYEQDTGVYPTTDQGLEALVSPPPGTQGWRGPYIKGLIVPKDPWGELYIYTFPTAEYPTLYELISRGPDGELGTEDDITNLPRE